MERLKLNIQRFASGTFSLGQSDRLIGQIVWRSSANGAIANNSSVTGDLQIRVSTSSTRGTFSWGLSVAGNNQSGTWYGTIGTGWTTIATVSGTQGHNADGTGSAFITGWATGPSGTTLAGKTVSGSATVGLDRIYRFAVINSFTGSDIEGKFKVTYTSYVSSYIYKLRISIPNVKSLQTNNYASGAEFTLNESTLEYLYSYTKNTNSVTLGAVIETWSGSTKLGESSELYINGKVMNANPTFTTFDYNDINPITVALTGDSKTNVNGYSTIRSSISNENKAIALKGASMTKYRFTIGDLSKDISYSDTDEVYADIENSPNGTYKVYAIDSRNNSTEVVKNSNKNITYDVLYLDKTNSSVTRDNGGVGKNAILTYKGTIWNNSFGKIQNSLKSAVYRFKKTTSSEWITGTTDIKPTIDGNNFEFSSPIKSNNADYTFDLGDSYDVEITIKDELSTATIYLVLNSAVPNLALADKGVGLMGAYDENVGGLVQIGGERFENLIPRTKVLMDTKTTAKEGTITLSESYKNFDYIIMFGGGSGGRFVNSSVIIPTEWILENNRSWSISAFQSSGVYYQIEGSFTDEKTFKYSTTNAAWNTPSITKVIGVKF